MVFVAAARLPAGGRDAAALTAPRLATLLDGERGDQQADERIQPPGADEGVAEQAEEQRAREIRAEHVLAAFALRRGGAEPVGEALLGDAEVGHDDEARRAERDAQPAHLCVRAVDERLDGLEADVRREDEELNRDEPLRAGLRGVAVDAVAGEAPHDYEAGEPLDGGVEPEADERDRPGEDAGEDGDGALERHVAE
ncbi:MAG: hypothetical protein LT070_13250 [Solirubrobacteraceae bacterium]|nr:hypothetical protein [Solirubrobacteraceae bacterium]